MASGYRPRIADAELRACLGSAGAVLLDVDIAALAGGGTAQLRRSGVGGGGPRRQS
jgi:hypothetical protein